MLNILEALQDYEIPDEVLKEKMLGEFRVHVPTMFDYLDVFFKHKTLPSKKSDTIAEKLIKIEVRKPDNSNMDVDIIHPMETSLRTLKLSNVEKVMDSYKDTGDMMFAGFDIQDNSHPVSNADVMKDIATFARESLDINKPIYLHGLRFPELLKKQN